MGLRPSVKSEDGTTHSNQRRCHMNDFEPNYRDEKNSNDNSHNLNKNDPSSSPSPSSPPSNSYDSSRPPNSANSSDQSLQPPNPAWTARGKLLLNFHDAISRAINSPEMAEKCSQIAEQTLMNESNGNNSHDADCLRASESFIENSSNEGVNTKTNSSITNMAEEYSAEANLIIENKSKRDAQVRNKSVALGVAIFISLRSVSFLRKRAGLWLGNSTGVCGFGGKSHYTFDHLPSSSSTSRASPPKSFAPSPRHHRGHHPHHLQPQLFQNNQTNKSIFQKSARLIFDLAFSTTITFLSGTFLFMPRPTAYVEDMSKLPLVEGKSVYAEMVCPPLIKEYQRVLEEYGGRWPVGGDRRVNPKSSATFTKATDDHDNNKANNNMTQEDVSLNTIRNFVENCSKRRKFEKALLEERKSLKREENDLARLILERIKSAQTQNEGESSRNGGTTEQSNGNDVEMVGSGVDFANVGEIMVSSSRNLGTVSIPSPGVPEDIIVNLDKEVLALTLDVVREEEDN